MANPLARMRDSLVEQLGDTKAYGELMERTEKLPMKADAKLKVIGAGYSRTGTLSTYSAFMTLGMKTYHGSELMKPEIGERWRKVVTEDLKIGNVDNIDWLETLRGFEAGVDLPFCDYWLQIAQAFPDAKVVYTNRDGQQWLASMQSALEEPYVLNQWHYIATFWFPALRKGLKVVKLNWKKYERDHGGLHAGLLDERLENIKENIAPERLLVWHPREGWDRLCAFLDLPVPDEPFPNVNEGASIKLVFQTITLVGMSLWVASIAVAIGAIYLLLQRIQSQPL